MFLVVRLVSYLAIAVAGFATAAESDEAAPKKEPLDIEGIYYAQDELLKAALDRVRFSLVDVAEVYFVGFAPDDAEDVFETEVKHVEALFREQLGAEGRTVVLVNSRNTVDELPLANGPNLSAVLEGMAARMGPEDLLFLHVTTHGSSDHELSVSFENLGLNDLSAEEFAEIVGGAGLPWRVVVVSACFSGGFIQSLKSPRTMVITAASARRTSFGCENGRDYTYFGAAFYRDSLIDADFRGRVRPGGAARARAREGAGLQAFEATDLGRQGDRRQVTARVEPEWRRYDWTEHSAKGNVVDSFLNGYAAHFMPGCYS